MYVRLCEECCSSPQEELVAAGQRAHHLGSFIRNHTCTLTPYQCPMINAATVRPAAYIQADPCMSTAQPRGKAWLDDDGGQGNAVNKRPPSHGAAPPPLVPLLPICRFPPPLGLETWPARISDDVTHRVANVHPLGASNRPMLASRFSAAEQCANNVTQQTAHASSLSGYQNLTTPSPVKSDSNETQLEVVWHRRHPPRDWMIRCYMCMTGEHKRQKACQDHNPPPRQIARRKPYVASRRILTRPSPGAAPERPDCPTQCVQWPRNVPATGQPRRNMAWYRWTTMRPVKCKAIPRLVNENTCACRRNPVGPGRSNCLSCTSA
ncbi:uncharacterized protein B0T15DRAFT_143985 [Chaetomium strumarium]|uniref:Uncharacterized protein n=1 Tax=Chaetomium strumarium TaxID=1170767 RepID=A0AAJ0GUT6_9PEZI|nr:hypothetical protein B0T15DRAFT_143985 [Chaetomium strumarium]